MKPLAYLIVGNWKMYFSYNEAIAWSTQHRTELIDLVAKQSVELVLCPSFDAHSSVAHIFNKTPIYLGAQDCSRHKEGPYTGQVSARSLKQVGCSFCIIGHSEQRNHCDQTDIHMAHKAMNLLEHHITPILCVGETAEQFNQGKTLSVIDVQLRSFIEELVACKYTAVSMYIAYEPVWSVGTGVIPDTHHLEKVFFHINTIIKELSNTINFRCLYGGSIDTQTIATIKKLTTIHGFLIGKASTDFQEFKKIVLSL